MSRRALATGLGLGALATTESEDAEAIFLGTGARNAAHDMLGMAKTMEHRGVPRDEIWQKTGWGRGTDGHWRFEMDDREMFRPVPEVTKQSAKPSGKWAGREAWYRDDDGAVTAKRPLGFDFNGNRIGWNLSPRNLQNLTGGDQLLENYPALAAVDIPSTRIPEPALMKTGNGGSMYGVGEGYLYADESDGTYLGPVYPAWSQEQHRAIGQGAFERPPTLKINQIYEEVPNTQNGADEMLESGLERYRNVAVHELQHAVQDLEGWAQGAAFSEGRAVARAAGHWESKALWDGGESTRGVDPLIDEYDKLVEKWTDLDRQIAGDFDSAPQELLDRYARVEEDIEFLNLRYPYVRQAAVDRKLGEADSRMGEGLSDMQAYKNTAGEVEARNAQIRRDMTPQERREKAPWKTADTPEFEQTTIGLAPDESDRFRTTWQPQRERLVRENILGSSGYPEVRDLMRGFPPGMYESDAWDLVQPQMNLDRQTLIDNLDNYFAFYGGSPERRSEMLMEAERINAENNGRQSPYTGQRSAAPVTAAALTAAASANANAAEAGQELGVLEELYDNTYAGQQAQELGDIVTGLGIDQMVDASAGIDFNPVVNDFSGALADVTASRNELNETARDILQYGAADAVDPTAGNQIAGVLQDVGLYDGNATAAQQTGDTLATIGQMGYEMTPPGYLATAPGYIAEAQQNIAEGDGGLMDYATLGVEALFSAVPGGRSTIRGAARKYKPGIYQEPGALLEAASAKVAPESPALDEVFGVTRQDLYDIGSTRQGNQDVQLLGAAKNPKGTAHAGAVTKPANTQRLVNALENARGSELEKGMVGWYVMDPLYQSYKAMGLSDDEAIKRFNDFQAITGIHSANSDVMTELNRGTGALYLNEQGRLDDYFTYGGKMGQPGAPADMDRIRGHMGHKTAHGVPTRQYYETGALQMKSPKVPAYIQAAGVPETGFQTNFPVGDAHFSRAIGLSDVRPELAGGPGASWSMPEALQLAPWWRDDVAGQVGLESVPAQALAWGLYGPQTGVETAIAAPKLEILADMIAERARERGISIEQAREEILMAQDYVGALTSK